MQAHYTPERDDPGIANILPADARHNGQEWIFSVPDGGIEDMLRLLTQSGALPVGPLVLAGLFAVVCRRAGEGSWGSSACPPKPPVFVKEGTLTDDGGSGGTGTVHPALY